MTTGESESPSPNTTQEETTDSQTPATISTLIPPIVKHVRPKKPETRTIQVANIAPQATREQMQTLFSYVGKIDEIRLFPSVDLGMTVNSKICFVKFYDTSSVGVSQHLTNTVFIDRALIVIPFMEPEIPEEIVALELLNSGSLLPGIADPKLPQHVSSQLEGIPPHQMVATNDPKLLENNLPPYPNLNPMHDKRKIEEIRRTVMIANLDSGVPSQDIVDYFSNVGEVKYFRLCTRDNDPLHYALIEFTDQPAVLEALKLNGTKLGSKIIKVYHATQAIIKPQAKTNEAAQKEIEDAMSRQAQTILSQGLDGKWSGKDKRRSRSRSRRRSISRTRGRLRSRSRSRSRKRSRSRRRSSSRSRRSKRSRSRSRDHKRSRSKRDKSKGRHRKSRSRSKSHTKIKRSRSKSRKGEEKDKKRVKRDRDKDEKDKEKDKEKDRDRDKEREKDRDKDRGKEKEKRSDKERDREKRDKDRDKDKREKDRDKDRKERERDKEEKEEENGKESKRSRDKERDREKKKEKNK